jgi:2-polyprenyl-3-methyl-5-hydroxy-6-metoxy-1,4-benzoquinol methylase
MKTTRVLRANGIKEVISIENATKLYRDNPGEIYSKAFFNKRHRKNNEWKIEVGKMLVDMYDLESIVDFGCGEGEYLEGALRKGVKTVLGFEYLYANVKPFLTPTIMDFIKEGNVMETIDCGRFDLAMSIEVAEHILPEKSDVFVDNLVNASKRCIMLTAAKPEQGGMGHINEQSREFWIKKFEERGCQYSKSDVLEIKDMVSDLGIEVASHILEPFFFWKD